MQRNQSEPETLENNHLNPHLWVSKFADYLYSYAITRINDKDQARDLVQETFLAALERMEKLELQVHLASCSICVTFMQQSAVINQMAKKLSYSNYTELKLDEGFKEQLQKRIHNHLDKN